MIFFLIYKFDPYHGLTVFFFLIGCGLFHSVFCSSLTGSEIKSCFFIALLYTFFQFFFWWSCLFTIIYMNSEDLYKRKLQKSKAKGAEKPFHIPIQDRSSCCKFSLFRLILVIMICGTIVTLLYSPDVEHLSHSGRR